MRKLLLGIAAAIALLCAALLPSTRAEAMPIGAASSVQAAVQDVAPVQNVWWFGDPWGWGYGWGGCGYGCGGGCDYGGCGYGAGYGWGYGWGGCGYGCGCGVRRCYKVRRRCCY
jgi:hypothetical protein